MRSVVAISLAALLASCVSAPAPQMPAPPAPPRASAGPPPPMDSGPAVAQSQPGFIAPRILDAPGLGGVIGANETALANIFGPPRLTVREGDALKLQFSGRSCVLDVFLYPLVPNGEPNATWVEARRPSDGQDADRASCVAALKR